MTRPKLRIGVVGLGTFVDIAHLPCYFESRYAESLELAAVCDLNQARLDEVGNARNISARYTDSSEMFNREDLDAVVVVTPDHAHTGVVLQALEAGLDVLVEKPMTMNVVEADKIVRKAKEHRRRVLTDFHKREDPAHQEARSRILSGKYGSLQFGWGWMQDTITVPAGGFFKSDLAARSSPVWFLGVHFFDLLRFLTNRQPLHVKATGFKEAVKARGIDTWDAVKADFILDNGAAVSFCASWNLPDSTPSITTQGLYMQFSHGDLMLDSTNRGFYESDSEKYSRVNPMFLRQTPRGKAGYGVESIGEALLSFLELKTDNRESVYERQEKERPSGEAGFFAALMGQGVDCSLTKGRPVRGGMAVIGEVIDLNQLLKEELGDGCDPYVVEPR